MKKYNIKLSAQFPILAENEEEAVEIANQQVRLINREYSFLLGIEVVPCKN